MSFFAQKWNSESGQWEPVHAANLNDIDRKYLYRCASCHAPSILAVCKDKENYFMSKEHTLDCPEAKGHKLLRINTRTEIDFNAILDYEDHDPVPQRYPSTEDEAEEDTPDTNNVENPDADLRLDPDATHFIRSASGMYKELAERRGSDYIDSFVAKEVDSIFLRRDTFLKFRNNWGSPMKLVVAKRCSPKNLKYNISVPKGYVILRDAYSRKDEEAIYFLVKMCHPEHDRRFKERLFGHTERNKFDEVVKGVGKDPHRNIIIFAQWAKVPDPHYQVYSAQLNSKMVAFINAVDT